MIRISEVAVRVLTTRQLFGFLKSDQAKTALSARIAQEAASMKRTEAFRVQQVQQAQTLSVFTVVATAFLPLSFCTSVCCLVSKV